MGVLRAVRMGCARLGLKENLDRAEELLSELLKGEKTAEWRDSKLIYTVLSLAIMDKQEPLSPEDIANLVEQF
jgi:hypothetical protein